MQELADALFADEQIDYVRLKSQEVVTVEPIDVTGESSFFAKLKKYPYEFEIDENLQLASIDGSKIKEPVLTYTVTYHANGGMGSVPSSVTQKDNTIVAVNFETLPTKEGYEFLGWATTDMAKEAEYTATGTKEFTLETNDVTLYAVWKMMTYQIEYDLAGGSVTGNPTSYTVETKEMTLKNPIRHGYDFVRMDGKQWRDTTVQFKNCQREHRK